MNRGSRSHMFFGTGVLKNSAMLEFLFNKISSGLHFYQKETPTFLLFCEIYKIFKSIFFKEHFRWLLLQIFYELSLYCIWEWWIVSLRGLYWLSNAYFILLRVFCFFLFLSFFLIFFVDFTTCLGTEVSQYLK